jgi:hypothetical protein
VEKVIQKAGSLALLLALGYLLLFIVLASLRLFYPFELEWIEGAYVDESHRVLQGFFPYGPPSIFFIPTSKTPLFFYLSAGLMKLFGVGFLAPRLLSVLATLGCFALLIAIVKRESGRDHPGVLSGIFPGVLAAGIYAASFRFTGAWMDLAKTDSLFLFLILAAFYAGQRARQPLGLVVSGGLFALAYFTKQLTLPVVLALAPVSLLATRGRSWLRWLAAGAIGLVAFWILDAYSAGWFSFYTFDTVSTHAWQPDFWLFWRLFLPKMGPALLLAVFYAILVIRKTFQLRWDTPAGEWECLGLGGALILASWSIFIKTWTYDNGFMLASLGVSLLAGLGTARILDWGKPHLEPRTGRSGLPVSFKSLTLGVLFLQFGLLFYNPVEQLPTAADRSKAESFVQLVASLPGEVLVFNHGFVNHLAGKTGYLHNAPYGDVVGSAAPPGSDTARRRETVLEAFNQALAEQRFDWIVLDKPETSWPPYYVYVAEISDETGDFYPVTGARTRPESLMAKNPVARGGQLPLDQNLYDRLFTSGWSQPQAEGRWAVGERPTIQVALEQKDYRLVIQVQPGCAGGRPVVIGMNAGWNGTRLGQGTFSSCALHTFTFEIIRGRVAEDFNELWFEFDHAPAAVMENILTGQLSGWAAFRSIAFIQR